MAAAPDVGAGAVGSARADASEVQEMAMHELMTKTWAFALNRKLTQCVSRARERERERPRSWSSVHASPSSDLLNLFYAVRVSR